MSLEKDLGLNQPVTNPGHAFIIGIVLTASLVTKEGDRFLRPFGITDSQFNVLMLLKHQSTDGALNQTRLGSMLLVNRSNVTGLIDRMEQAGWVRRSADKTDRRVKAVVLTDAGVKLVTQAERAYFERIKAILGEFPESSILQASRFMDRLRQRLRKS